MKTTLVALWMLACLCAAPGCTTAQKEPAVSAAPSQPGTVTDVLRDPRFRQVAAALEGSGH